jgi:hypothetical protein
MKIPNPFRVIGWVIWALWAPFGWMFGQVAVAVAKNDRSWNWVIKCMQSKGVDVEPMQAARRKLLSGGAEVILPPTVERTTSDEEKISGEAKP